jgi:NADH:ubiquinone oxidoreductase subunit 5 (subunit L)/multisubunit Na+/H+ antiporter MnhA subunit
VGVAAVSVSMENSKAAAAVLYYLIVYAFANVGAFATAAWLVRDKDSDDIDDLNGLGYQEPMLAICILVLMLSLIGIPPLAGFFGKLYVFMEALNQPQTTQPVSLIWLVALGLFNSVVSAFYYVRVLKAMFMRQPGEKRLAPASRAIAVPIVLGTIVVVLFGIVPDSLISIMRSAAVTMLTKPVIVPAFDMEGLKARPQPVTPAGAPVMSGPSAYGDMMKRGEQMKGAGGPAQKGGPAPGKKAPGKAKTGGAPSGKNTPEKTKSGAGANRSPSARSPLEAVAMKVTTNH